MSDEKAPGEWGLIGPPVCPTCKGDTWVLDHEDECYYAGSCNCTGVQVPCQRCQGTGHEGPWLNTMTAP